MTAARRIALADERLDTRGALAFLMDHRKPAELPRIEAASMVGHFHRVYAVAAVGVGA